MIAILDFLYFLADTGLELLTWAIFITVIASWLIAFNVINPYNPFVGQILNTLNRIIEPLCRPIRRLLPDLGGIDLAPMILVILIIGVRNYLLRGAFNGLASLL
ncbi:YggT family protein [Hankyongella ginsenosidimutans]|uniref:YggT family protein n=1 Tax=Hankyongella ginsenosidimutans TaxID=1763828 RepID=A0A4D7CC07_9SPHN|nr:YggT family protein [Hankyongella ginsenosidimutans]QCI79482.1 YggT family protein [Hankyongella ginsenosidimutans]TXG83639.1 MAG: YggT family protein [Sphingomonadales bacterium]